MPVPRSLPWVCKGIYPELCTVVCILLQRSTVLGRQYTSHDLIILNPLLPGVSNWSSSKILYVPSLVLL